MSGPLDVAADESTIHRWRTWIMAWVTYAAAVLESLSIRFNLPKAALCETLIPVLRPLVTFVGTAVGWLARAVRPIVNSNEWAHT
jgi:phage-related protein